MSDFCAVVNGGVWCWDLHGYSQLGLSSGLLEYPPTQVAGLTSAVQAVGAGLEHTCAVANGEVWCWGHNYCNDLGVSSQLTNSNVPVLVQFP